jgi:leader peptidase (prepilin peptidase)/N-methyltransferase
MEPTLAALFLAPGLAVGSFVNVVAARVPLRRAVVRPASACMSCGTPIAWHDNVPVVSYLFLRGRCRHCRSPIAVTYPAVEIVTAFLVAGCVLAFGPTAYAALAAFFCVVLVAVSATDLQHRIIPNRIVVPAAAIVLAAHTALVPSAEWALAALGAFAFLFLAALAYPKGMGMGDAKLALVIGAALGASAGVALMLALFLALVPGVFLLARDGAAARKQALPFGPFLALGAVIALFAGPEILDVYLDLFR